MTPAKKGADDADAAKKKSLSSADYYALLREIEELDDEAYADTLFDELSALVHVTYKDASDLLNVSASVSDVPPVWAINHVREAGQNVSRLVTERDKAKLIQILNDAFVGGLSAEDTATSLRKAFDSVRITTAKGDRELPKRDYFETVARTELQRAANAGQQALYRAAGVEKVRWQAAVPCDECAEYDDQVYPLNDVPDGGPPLHPRCRCVLVPADEDLGDWRGSDEDRAAARRGNQPEE